MNIESNQLLRFTTAGNVDDGKSTLIGRLLYDSKSIFEDQLQAAEETSRKKGSEGIDLALFTDGLRDERAQGITIDVAYRYFTTPKRKFIIADTPGHVQYTRNMVTGASTANAALILIDARKGITEQTKRHSFIASLLQIPHLIICVNKMDLVGYDEGIYRSIVNDYESIASKMAIRDVRSIPISALKGDNVVHASNAMDWYKGMPLLGLLEDLHISSDLNKIDARFPVQTVLREQNLEYRAYAGRIESGIFRVGDLVTVLPDGIDSTISSIQLHQNTIEEAYAPMSVAISLSNDIDISRGNMLVKKNNQPQVTQDLDAMICWFNQIPARMNGKYIIRHTTNETKCILKEIIYKIDMDSLDRNSDDKTIVMNDLGRIKIKLSKPLMIDPYRENRLTGSFILIDEQTNETVAAGMIL